MSTLAAAPTFEANAPATARRWLATAREYFNLTRPRVLTLVLLTAPPAMVLQNPAGWPAPLRILTILLGITLVGASCSAFNAWWERDTDGLMERTRDRPLPMRRIPAWHALVFGFLTGLLGLGWLWQVGGAAAAFWGAVTLAHYVVIYTVWLKHRHPLNIVIGGAAGASAPLIASAAVMGHVTLAAWLLFLAIFLWTPAHFWAIALVRKEEYANAGIPMMPSAIGDAATRQSMMAYTLLLVPVSLMPWALGHIGAAYGILAIVLGGWFIAVQWKGIRQASIRSDRKTFGTSIAYLFLLFLAFTFCP